MAIAPKGDIAVLTGNALVVHAAQGGVIDSFTVNQPRGLALDAEGRPVVITERGLMRARAQLVTLRAGDAATGRPLEELAAAGIFRTATSLPPIAARARFTVSMPRASRAARSRR